MKYNDIYRDNEQLSQLITHSLKYAESALLASNFDDFFPLWFDYIILWNILSHLISTTSSSSLRKLHAELQIRNSNFTLAIYQNDKLYNYCKNYTCDNSTSFTIMHTMLRGFCNSGIHLLPVYKTLFNEVSSTLHKLELQYSINTIDSLDEYAYYVSETKISSVPKSILNTFTIEGDKYKLTLHNYQLLMSNCANREVRQELYSTYTTLATFGKFDNANNIKDILQLRYQLANLLGYSNFAQMNLKDNMLNSVEQVFDFLYDLLEQVLPYAKNDLIELQQFASQHLNIESLDNYDILYATEQSRKHKYSFSLDDLRPYLVLEKVFSGMTTLLKKIYNVEFIQCNNMQFWHKEAVAYDIKHNNVYCGQIVFDLFSRSGKQQGAWANPVQDRYLVQEEHYYPVCYVMCNFLQNHDSLLSFEDVLTLFHEVGHALHQVLSQVNHFLISGIDSVQFDVVELPSQLLEYFVWEYETLSSITEHHETKEVLSHDLYNNLIASRYHMSALFIVRQLYFSIFDLIIHMGQDISDINKLFNDFRSKIMFSYVGEAVMNSFTHVFCGEYAAGYYSYLWSQVLASNIYNGFKIRGHEFGKEFTSKILTQGSVVSMKDVFEELVQHTPDINIFLHYAIGLPKNSKNSPISRVR